MLSVKMFYGNGQDIGSEDGWALRGTIQADLGDRGKIDLWVKHSEDNDVATGGYVLDNCDLLANGYCHVNAAGLSDGTGGVINGLTGASASPFENFSNDLGLFSRTTDIFQGKITYDLGGIDLTSITNYTKLSKNYREDGDALPTTVIQFLTDARYKQFSQAVTDLAAERIEYLIAPEGVSAIDGMVAAGKIRKAESLGPQFSWNAIFARPGSLSAGLASSLQIAVAETQFSGVQAFNANAGGVLQMQDSEAKLMRSVTP
jgi:hypothetical protein